jgi:rhomboid protease GluP
VASGRRASEKRCYTGEVPDPQTLLLSVVTRLLDDPAIPAQLLALSDTAAVLGMADGSLTAMLTPAFGPPEELGANLRDLVEKNPGAHLKLVIVGGDPALREQLPKGGAGVLSRRAVQLFHLSPGGESEGAWALWTGGGARPDSPLGLALSAAGRGELPPPDREALTLRVERPPPLSPEERARLSEGQAFVASLRVRPWATWGLLCVLGAIFVLEELWGGSETAPTLVRMGGNTDATLAGEPWRLLSSALLHAGWFHAVANGFVLLVLGGFIEKVLGAARYGVLLGAAAVGGSLASALVSAAPLSVGASGAIWGVLGAAAALSWRPGSVIPAVMVGPLRRNAMINLVINLAVSFHPQVDAWAHLGGGVVGAALLFGGVLTRGLAEPGAARRPARGLAIAAGAMLGLVVASLAAAWSTGKPWQLVAAPTSWARHALGPVSIETPALLGAPVSLPGDDRVSVWEIGDLLRDPLVLTVVVKPHGREGETLADHVRSLENEDLPAPEGARVLTPWHRLPGGGSPTFEVEYAFEDRYLMSVFLQAHDDVDVQIESIRWTPLAAKWAEPLQRVHASLAGGEAR